MRTEYNINSHKILLRYVVLLCFCFVFQKVSFSKEKETVWEIPVITVSETLVGENYEGYLILYFGFSSDLEEIRNFSNSSKLKRYSGDDPLVKTAVNTGCCTDLPGFINSDPSSSTPLFIFIRELRI